jgi:hypothetical protein
MFRMLITFTVFVLHSITLIYRYIKGLERERFNAVLSQAFKRVLIHLLCNTFQVKS